MVGNQYNLLLVAFYLTYSLMSVPWTVIAKKFSPAVVMPILIAGWGILTLSSVASKSVTPGGEVYHYESAQPLSVYLETW